MKGFSIPKNYKIGCGALALAVLIIAPTVANCKRVSEVRTAIETLSDVLASAEEREDAYFVKSTADGVVLFDRVSGEKITTLPITVASLPAVDRAALERGISLYSVAEVVALIQDYCD